MLKRAKRSLSAERHSVGLLAAVNAVRQARKIVPLVHSRKVRRLYIRSCSRLSAFDRYSDARLPVSICTYPSFRTPHDAIASQTGLQIFKRWLGFGGKLMLVSNFLTPQFLKTPSKKGDHFQKGTVNGYEAT